MNNNVIKASGNKETFNEEKLITSLRNIGVSDDLIFSIIKKIKRRIKDDSISTEQIYLNAVKYLKKIHPLAAKKYTLKRAIMDMGPAGFIFERYIAKILNSFDYETKVGVIVKGHCVEHEIDIIANKNGRSLMIECKYHNHPGTYSDLKTALYTYSRYMDVKNSNPFNNNGSKIFNQGWLITNTKCTTEAIKYASCMDLKILAWHHPESDNLENLIEKHKLYPITMLSAIPKNNLIKLFEKNIYLVKELEFFKSIELEKILSVDSVRAGMILEEISILL